MLSQPSHFDFNNIGISCVREMFFDAIFEVIDIWTVSLELDEYTTFAKTLLHRITKSIEHDSALHLLPLSEIDGGDSGATFYDIGNSGPYLAHRSLVSTNARRYEFNYT